MMSKHLIAVMTALAMLAIPIAGDAAPRPPKVKYAKTEVDRAVGKCFGSILGGALLGAIAGRVVDGRRGTGRGAAIGAGVGAAYCAVIMSDARKRDRIVQAQLASAAYGGRPYMTTLEADDGQPLQFIGRAGASQTVDGSLLQPVRYKLPDGSQRASPVLDTGGRECRQVASTLGDAALPGQLTCRTPEGNYEPYATKRT